MILAIDPGTEQSAWLVLADGHIQRDLGPSLPSMGIGPNETVMSRIRKGWHCDLVIESIESYGMPVGREVFQTAYWIGRFDSHCTATLMPRRTVKLHLCGSPKATDANIRAALIDRFGPGKAKAVGLKATPGPLHGVKTHLWSALALAVTHHDRKTGIEGVR